MKLTGLSKNVVSMGVVSFWNDLSSDMIFPYIPIFLTQVLGASVAFVGLVEGIADGTAALFRFLSGATSDRIHKRKPFVLFGYSLSALSKPLLSLAGAPWHVLGVRILDRIGKGTRDAPRDALIDLSTERRYLGRAFGFHRTADSLGAALGPLVAFAVMPFIGGNLRTLFLLSFVASACAVVTVIVGVREVPDEFATEGVAPPARVPWRSLDVRFLIFVFAATVFALGKSSDAFLLLRARDASISLGLIPIIYLVYSLSFVVCSTPAGILSDRIGHRNTFMIGMFAFTAVSVLLALFASPGWIWLLFALYGAQAALTDGVGRAIVADLVPPAHTGTAFGIYNAFTGIALLPASFVFGLLWTSYGAPAAFLYGAVMGVIALLLFSLLRLLNRGSDQAVGLRAINGGSHSS